MALALTEEHLALADSVRGWAGHTAPPAVIRAGLAAEDHGAATYRDTLRAGLAAQGLLGLHLPEALGGQGYGLPELAVATEELGFALFPGAFLPTVLASAVVAGGAAGAADTGVLESLVKGMAAGTLTGAVGLAPGIQGAGGPDGLVLEGTCGPVLGAGLADLVVLPVSLGRGGGVEASTVRGGGAEASRDGTQVWVAVDSAELDITPLDGLDLTRPIARVSASGLRVPPGRVLSGLPQGLVRSLAATLFGAEACGIAGWAVETAASYAKVRHQFGRPIGQFQAVKHRCAWMLTAAEQAAAAVWDAARSVADDETGRDFATGVAAMVAVDAAVSCANDCIQDARRHRLHLGARRAPVLPPGAVAARAARRLRRGWAAEVARLALGGATRPLGVELPAEAEAVRAEVREDLAAIEAAPAADHAKLLAAGGWVVPHMPRPWGRERDAARAARHRRGDEVRGAARARPRHRRLGGARACAVRHGRAAGAVPAGHPVRRDRLVPAVQRARGRLGPRRPVHPGRAGAGGRGSKRGMAADRAEGVDLAGRARVLGHLRGPDRPGRAPARRDQLFPGGHESPGVTVRPLREMTGDSLFNEVFLDGVFVPDDLVVGEVNNGWRVARTTLANERVSLSQSWTFGCGAPELLEVLRGLARAPDAAVLERAGRLVGEGHAIDLLGLRTTLKRLSGTEPGATGSVRKLLGMRYAQRVAEECWTLTGADGAQAGTRWSRAVLFTRALTIGGGTTDVQLNIIGERLLGLPRDPAPGT